MPIVKNPPGERTAERTAALLRRSRRELREWFDCECQVHFGHEFLDSLFYGTMLSLAARTESSGFCPTSHGEENGIHCYGQTHYPRDTAEAACVLAAFGMADAARRILEFSLLHRPPGQYHIPHVYRRDATIQANTLQTDTPGHLARALLRCAEVGGVDDAAHRLFLELSEVFAGTWRHHFRPEYQLLDSGNYNEQFDGGGEPLLDLFSNASIHAGCEAMASLAGALGREKDEAIFRERREQLAAGIEKVLYDHSRGYYRSAFSLRERSFLPDDTWVSLYCQRWYPGQAEAWERAHRQLRKETALQWERFTVITGETPGRRFMVLGKFLGQQLGYFAQCGHRRRLEEMLDFLVATVRRPENLYPEWWFHHPPETPGGYMKDFLADHRGLWTAYTEDPAGDYTVDSGNCEQCSVFLQHMMQDVLGVRYQDGVLHLRPARRHALRCDGLPVMFRDHRLIRAGYDWRVDDDRAHFRFSVDGSLPVLIELPLSSAPARRITFNGQPVNDNGRIQRDREGDKFRFSLLSESAGEIVVEDLS